MVISIMMAKVISDRQKGEELEWNFMVVDTVMDNVHQRMDNVKADVSDLTSSVKGAISTAIHDNPIDAIVDLMKDTYTTLINTERRFANSNRSLIGK